MADEPNTRIQLNRTFLQAVSVGASVALIVAMTLFEPPDWLWLVPDPLVDNLGFRPLEMLLNVALFIPLGLSLGWWWPNRARVVWWAVTLSLCVELIQLGLDDRVSDLVDVATNSLGAGLGFLLGRHLLRRRRARLDGGTRPPRLS